MALLIVNALSEDTIAAPGNSQPNYIVVSVTDANGVPVTGLGIANFAATPIIVGPGGSLGSISTVTGGGMAGIYSLNVIPSAGQTWKAGVYIYAVAVTSGANHGQNLCSVLMD